MLFLLLLVTTSGAAAGFHRQLSLSQFMATYSKSQLSRDTGGPKDPDMLLTAEDNEKEFLNCEVILCHEIEREVVEGEFHTGLASVVQFIGKKKN